VAEAVGQAEAGACDHRSNAIFLGLHLNVVLELAAFIPAPGHPTQICGRFLPSMVDPPDSSALFHAAGLLSGGTEINSRNWPSFNDLA